MSTCQTSIVSAIWSLAIMVMPLDWKFLLWNLTLAVVKLKIREQDNIKGVFGLQKCFLLLLLTTIMSHHFHLVLYVAHILFKYLKTENKWKQCDTFAIINENIKQTYCLVCFLFSFTFSVNIFSLIVKISHYCVSCFQVFVKELVKLKST